MTGGLLWLLLDWAAQPDADKVRARLDAFRTALSVGVGAGGVFALWLAARRQRTTELQLIETTRIAAETKAHSERVAEVTERDLEERRVTELYTKAVEQLGSDKAPVRLGGLYALERVGQENPPHRQTIINVICAYLRMPFEPPSVELRGPAATAAHRALSGSPAAPDTAAVSTDELQVRLAAQSILREHLRPGPEDAPSAKFWSDIDLDLQRACLVEFSFWGCRVRLGDFSYATFFGDAHFAGTVFAGDARFFGVQFNSAYFSGASFSGYAAFSWCHFRGDAHFPQLRVVRNPLFNSAVFDGESFFYGLAAESTVELQRTRWAKLPEYGETWLDLAGARLLLPESQEGTVKLPPNCSIEGRDGEYVILGYGVPGP
ncbi:pentapeptide repeat-containing protein [Amycolatopsis samaneae]|uniref:pentapeptide repeat-containing protein n=1 Tax=Amycolatopsis samaneae TaxID=664691 RepID=UPI0031EB83A0